MRSNSDILKYKIIYIWAVSNDQLAKFLATKSSRLVFIIFFKVICKFDIILFINILDINHYAFLMCIKLVLYKFKTLLHCKLNNEI